MFFSRSMLSIAFAAFASIASGASQAPSLAPRIESGGRLEIALTLDPMGTDQIARLVPLGGGPPVWVAALPGDSADLTLRDPQLARGAGFFRVEFFSADAGVDSDGDGASDWAELHATPPGNPLNPAPALDQDDGAVILRTREEFDFLAAEGSVAGAAAIPEVKFLITGVSTASPKLHLMHSENHEYHYYFAVAALGYPGSLSKFNSETYFSDTQRMNIAGSLLAHDHYRHPDGAEGVITLEFWPSDPVGVEFVKTACRLVSASLPFVDRPIAYHPSGETQEALHEAQAAAFRASRVPVIGTRELFGNITFSALNPGVAFGRLRALPPGVRPSARDIVILSAIPNDLPRVSGIITDSPQTPLSHINLKARQDGIPNAFIEDAAERPDLAPLLGSNVRLEVTAHRFTVAPATQEEVDSHLESLRPDETQIPAADLSVTTIAALEAIGFDDADAFGAKAANVAELRKFLPAGVVPDGYAIPFSFYDRFMRGNGLYDAAAAMMANPDFQSDDAVRSDRLAMLRAQLLTGQFPPDMAAALGSLQNSFPAGTGIRCRSSASSEDLEGFSGAGLYESFTHRPDEGHLASTIRQVWASLWTLRAYDEREFYRVSHLDAAMGVLCHPNYDFEQANGVGVTRNLFDPAWTGYYINAQVGEDLVTNPESGATPDELLVSAVGQFYDYEIQYIRRSNLLPAGETVLSRGQVLELVGMLRQIHSRFRLLYNAVGDSKFAMEVEFKITADGRIAIKQARPWAS